MEMQMEIDDLGLSPSFNCYFSDSLTTTTAMAAARVSREFIHEQQSTKFHELIDVDEEDDFEFSQVFDNDNEKQVFSGKQISVNRLPPAAAGVGIPVGELDIQIRKLYVNGGETSSFSNSSSSSSTESEIESNNNNGPSGSFCMWRPKPDVVSPILTNCKKSNSGSGSGSRRRWRRILDLIRRSNGGSIFFSRSNKKIKASKQNRKVTPVEVAGKLKSSAGSSPPSFHEVFYARKRAEREGDKMKSFLPYRQDLLGFFVNINRIGSKKSTTF